MSAYASEYFEVHQNIVRYVGLLAEVCRSLIGMQVCRSGFRSGFYRYVYGQVSGNTPKYCKV